jgi:thioredoxin-like negative regulator of GroEL
MNGDMEVMLFSASWCGPCKVLKGQVVPELEKQGVTFNVIDIDDEANQELVAEHKVRGIPTMILPDGQSLVGTQTVSSVRKALGFVEG